MVPGFGFPRALANLYEDPEWSQKDLAGPTELLKTQVTKSKLGVLAPSQLRRYRQELAERARLGHPACFTNLWALINEALLHDEVGQGAAWGAEVGGQSRSKIQRGEQGWGGQAPGAMALGSGHLPTPAPAPRPQTLRPAGSPGSWPESSTHLLCPQHQGEEPDHL